MNANTVFANWLPLKRKLDTFSLTADVTIDLSNTRLVDHTVMEKLHELGHEFEAAGGHLRVNGLDHHRSLSRSPVAARKKRASTLV